MAPLLKHRWTLAILLGSLAYVLAHSDNPSLTVTAPSGTYTGIMNGTVPNVRQYLGIPYSLPPVGDRRWLPPTKFPSNPSVHIPATDFPPGCPQYGPRFPTVFNQYLTQNTIPWGSQNHTPGTMVWSSNEDCLYLAVWTPASASKKSKLPVIMFIAGGGFVNSGSVNAAWYKPHQWVQRTQAHVAVTIKSVMILPLLLLPAKETPIAIA